MTDREAEELLSKFSESQCLRIYQRVDGRIMTDNCPGGLRAIRNTCRFVASFVAGFVASLVTFIPDAGAQSALAGSSNTNSPAISQTNIVTGRLKRIAPPPAVEVIDQAFPPNAQEASDPNGIRAFVPAGWPFEGLSNSSNGPGKKQIMLGSDEDCAGNPYKPAVNPTVKPSNTLHAGDLKISLPGEPSVPSVHNSALRITNSGGTEYTKSGIGADLSAYSLYHEAKIAELIGSVLVALTYYKSALSACDAQASTDPKFRKIIQADMSRLRSSMTMGVIP